MMTTRRSLMKAMVLGGGGLSLGLSLGGCSSSNPSYSHGNSDDFNPNAFLAISPDGSLSLQIARAEMGQGISTGFAQIVAEELDVEPSNFVIEFAGIHSEFRDPSTGLQMTGGSTSVKVCYEQLREAGATAKTMLMQAASAVFQVDIAELSARRGVVYNGDQSLTYGQLATLASKLPVPEKVRLKQSADFTLIGHSEQRVDSASKSDGSAVYGIDIQRDGMLTAVVVRSPAIGGVLVDFDASSAMAIDGVSQVVAVNNAVAIIATGYWPARKAAKQLSVNWDLSASKEITSAKLLAEQQRLLELDDGKNVRADGDYEASADDVIIKAQYRAPYLAHATMEPMNAVADVNGDKATVWGGNQSPDIARHMVAEALSLPRENVTVHTQYLGGGFGRRFVPDYMVEAALISRAVKAPVKLIWSREDDMANDYYRPSHMSEIQASISPSGDIAWRHHLVSDSVFRTLVPSLLGTVLPRWMPQIVPDSVAKLIASKDPSSVEGAVDLPYGFSKIDVDYSEFSPAVPVGFWRSVGHSQNAFVVESFIDEVAAATQSDPLQFRLDKLPDDAIASRVLDKVKHLSGWGNTAPGVFQGVAVHESFGSTVAEVVEISHHRERIRIDKVYCVVDCGRVINPDLVVTQMQGAIMFALTAALYGDITFEDGVVQQTNFDTYPMLRMDMAPEIVVTLVNSEASPQGVGEPGVPPLAPALANALFAATGQRQRSLPMQINS